MGASYRAACCPRHGLRGNCNHRCDRISPPRTGATR